MKSEYEKARKLAPDGIIGFNLMVAMEHYEEYVHAVVEAGADLIVSGAGLPTELPKYVGDSDILLAPIVSTAKSANVILKYWDKKYQRIPDLVVIEDRLPGDIWDFVKISWMNMKDRQYMIRRFRKSKKSYRTIRINTKRRFR